MGIQKLVPVAVALTFLVASTGQLPKVLLHVKAAQLKRLKESQSSNWGKAKHLPSR